MSKNKNKEVFDVCIQHIAVKPKFVVHQTDRKLIPIIRDNDFVKKQDIFFQTLGTFSVSTRFGFAECRTKLKSYFFPAIVQWTYNSPSSLFPNSNVWK